MSLWFKSGSETLLLNSSGNLIDCSTCPCANETPITTDCNRCSGGMYESWEFTVAGISNNSGTLCGDYNGTKIINWLFSCAFSENSNTRYWFMNNSFGLWELGAYELSSSITPSALYYPSSSFNCLGTNEFSLSSNDSQCTGWPSTITLTPA